jgi:predicted Rdx family selenoprotein
MKQLAAATIIAVLVLAATINVKAIDTKHMKCQLIETSLQLECWMTDETLWNTFSTEMTEFATETETDMQIENWMTDIEVWNVSNNYSIESETSLELEDWMTSETTWETNKNSEEPALVIESWMINDRF